MSREKEKIVFIHGLGQAPTCWDNTISALSVPVIPDCIPLFSMNKGKEMTYENLYHTFIQYCEKENEPLNLCGISLGAVLALNYAIDYPQRLRSLVLIAPQYKMPRLLLKLQNILFFFFPESYFQKVGFHKKTAVSLTKSMLNLDLEDGLSRILCPTAIICGQKDTANKKTAIGLADSISTSDLHLIEGTGHEVNIEAPDRLADILNLFYSSVE